MPTAQNNPQNPRGNGDQKRAEKQVSRNREGSAKILGEALRALKLRGGAARPECFDARLRQRIDKACNQRRLGADDDETDIHHPAKIHDRHRICRIERDTSRDRRNARIAGCGEELAHERAFHNLEGERMFAAAGAKEKDVHSRSLAVVAHGG